MTLQLDQRKTHRLKGIKLRELSLVDDPANQGAVVSIFKRKDPAPSDRDLGDEHMNEIEELKKKLADSDARATKAEGRIAELEKASSEAKAKHDAEIEKLSKVREAAEKDEVLKVGETEIKKSKVGDETFAFMKAQQAELEKERQARRLTEFSKRAESEMSHLKGEATAKAQVLADLEALPEASRNAVAEMLKSANEIAKASLTESGRGGARQVGNAEQELDKMAKARATATNVPFEKAYNEVLSTPEGRELYAKSLSERPTAQH